jgi:hypothetical protein
VEGCGREKEGNEEERRKMEERRREGSEWVKELEVGREDVDPIPYLTVTSSTLNLLAFWEPWPPFTP